MYGFRTTDIDGNNSIITPEVSSIISSGTVSIPTVLRPDNTFGVNVPLIGTEVFDEDEIGVLVSVRSYNPSYQLGDLGDGRWCRWLYYDTAFFTRNEATGVMSSFSEEQYKDTYYNFYPVAFWDKLGATTFNYVRLFSGVIFDIYDHSATEYKQIYHLGLIKEIDYVVFLKNI